MFFSSGLAISATVVPFVVFLLLYNFGGLISFLQVSGDEKARMFVITSAYMAFSAIFFAYYVAYDSLRRMASSKTACHCRGDRITFGILGYFDVAGLGAVFPQSMRAPAHSRIPNVFATYLIFPGVMLVQGFLLGTQRPEIHLPDRAVHDSGRVVSGIFTRSLDKFSCFRNHGVGLNFLLAPAPQTRRRILLITVSGAIGLAASARDPAFRRRIRELFLDRFTLVKDYDAGEKGRFGNQLNSIPLLLELPLGFGPFQFPKLYGMDPHNVYINAFASYGWLGGISYFLLVISTIIIGFKQC